MSRLLLLKFAERRARLLGVNAPGKPAGACGATNLYRENLAAAIDRVGCKRLPKPKCDDPEKLA